MARLRAYKDTSIYLRVGEEGTDRPMFIIQQNNVSKQSELLYKEMSELSTFK